MATLTKSINRPFEFNDIPVKTPDTFKPNFATTSTEDSDRTQDLVMHNTPMGTISSYSFEWRYIEPEEALLILSQVMNRSEYKLRYLNPLTARWGTGMFYTSNYSFGTLKQVNGKDAWESLSFNAVVINPV